MQVRFLPGSHKRVLVRALEKAMKFILIYTTYKDQDSADLIVNKLLDKKLIACAILFPIISRYRWKDGIENANEVAAILKTRSENWKKVQEFVESNHEYEIPCIIKLAEVEANTSYQDWIHQEING